MREHSKLRNLRRATQFCKNTQHALNTHTPAKQNLDQFVNAWESGDVPALIELLHEKATFAMPPMDAA